MNITGNIFGPFHISASGLAAERLSMDLIASNIANAQTTVTPEGGPFRRQLAILMEQYDALGRPAGVVVEKIIRDPSELRKVYEPGHPDADAEGYVTYPNVNIINEMVDMIAASRAYEANATAIENTKNIALKTINLLNI